MAKKCTPNDPILRDSSVEATNTLLAIEASYNSVFGMPMNELPVAQGALKVLTDELSETNLKYKAALGKKDVKNANRYKKQINTLKNDIRATRTNIKEAPKKFKLLTDIKNMLVGNIQKWADKQAYNINPNIYFPVISDYLLERYGFLPNNKTSIGGLAAIKKRLGAILASQEVREKTDEINTLKRQMQDPGILMLKQDPSGLAYDLVNKTREAPAEIFGAVNKYNDRIKVAVGGLRNWISNNNYLFKVNLPATGVATSETIAKSFENIVSFAFDAMDGRAKYIIPMPIGKGKEENAAFNKDEKAYNKIVRRNILDQINEGGEIQKMTTPQGQTFYYVTIKQDIDDHNGREVYYAYQVPHKPGAAKEGVSVKDFLLLPRSTKKGAKAEISRKGFDEALGQEARLATYVNEKGQTIQGRMTEGWYEAKTYKPLSGVRKENRYGMIIEREFNVFSYSSYAHNDNINTTDDPQSQEDLPPAFWDFIESLRGILSDFHTYATDKNRTTEQIRQKIVKKLTDVGANKMTVDEFDKLLKEVLSIDGLRSNMAIDNKGNLVTSNTHFGELYNYVMWRYNASDLIRGHVLARDALLAKINELTTSIEVNNARDTSEMTPAEVLDNTAKITAARLDLEELESLVQYFEDMVDVSTGKKSFHDTERLNQVQMIAAAQHRKGFINPFPTYDDDGNQVTQGRLATIDVFSDYFYDTARTLVHNDLRNDLMNVLGETSVSISEYMLDHVKATFGQMDVNAGMFGLDYSNPNVAKKLTSIMKKFKGPDYEITEEDIHTVSRLHSMFISGNLLQIGSTLNNHWQRLSVFIESVSHDWQEASRIFKGTNPNTGKLYADEIAEASGTTEVTIGLADSLMGVMSDDVTMGTGFFAKADLLILNLNKIEALKKMRNNSTWRSFFTSLIERLPGQQKATGKQLENIYDGIWELVNGIEKGTLTKKQIKGIQKNLEGILQADLVNKYASWGLKGGYAAGTFNKLGLERVLTFSGVEQDMRRWTAVQFAVQAVNNGQVPQEVIDDPVGHGYSSPYVHPNALKMARIGNNVTMFGLSPQYLPQMFRGGVGALLWKFKPYQWHQGRREILTMINYFDSLSETKKSDIVKEGILAGVPPYFGLGSKADMKLLGKKDLSEPFQKLRNFIWSRVLISLVLTPTYYMPIITEMQKFIRNQFKGTSAYGTGLRAMERGGESVIVSTGLRIMSMLALVGGFINPDDEEEEDQIWQDSARWFLPFYVNLALEFYQGRPMNAIRAYSQSAYRLANWTKDVFSWATGMEEEED